MLTGHRSHLRGLPLIAYSADDGAGGGAPPPAAPAAPAVAPDDDDDTPLGPKGEKALAAMKEELRAAKAAAKALPTLQAELDELRAKTMTDHEKELADAVAAARDETRSEVLGTVNSRLFTSELKAATTGVLLPAAAKDLLGKPEVALALLGLDEYPVTDTGDINSEAISQAVTAYVAARPHLAASATQTPGSADLGARTTPPPKDLAAQVAEAEAAGDWAAAGALKLQQLAALPRP